MSVIEFPGHRTQVVQRAQNVARTTCYNLAVQMRDDLLQMGLPVWQSKEIRNKIDKLVDDYREIVLDYYGCAEDALDIVCLSDDLDNVKPIPPSPFPEDEKMSYEATNWISNLPEEDQRAFDEMLDHMADALVKADADRFLFQNQKPKDDYDKKLDKVIKNLHNYKAPSTEDV